MPTIFRRFVEKDAHDWRQIYKALQLLEYIVKNGSERVVDEARAHLSTIKVLRSFHYIDEQGKDQGVNIRARAKELATLLSDVDMIRAERRKARANRAKYQGTGNTDFVPGSGGGRYGGFSSDTYYASGGTSGVYGSSGIGGSSASAAQPDFDEYDAGEDEDERSGATSQPAGAQSKVADLFSFDDEEPTTHAAPKSAGTPADADDFDDFQSAGPASSVSPTSTQAPKQSSNSLFDLLDDAPAPAPKPKPTPTTSVPAPKPVPVPAPVSLLQQTPQSSVLQPTAPKPQTASTASAQKAPAPTGGSLFDDLWAESRGKPAATKPGQKSMAELAQDQTSSSVWGPSKPAAGSAQGASTQKDLFDLL